MKGYYINQKYRKGYMGYIPLLNQFMFFDSKELYEMTYTLIKAQKGNENEVGQ